MFMFVGMMAIGHYTCRAASYVCICQRYLMSVANGVLYCPAIGPSSFAWFSIVMAIFAYYYQGSYPHYLTGDDPIFLI